MDYIETFRNLKNNNKYGRISPHKAVLLLTIIEMVENDLIVNNEIFYNDLLKDKYRDVWNRTLPGETIFQSDAYVPFWYLQSESFWHIVPIREKREILNLLVDGHTKPSESKIIECVKYAELDEDLFFLMTMPSSRTTLKRVLLETYFSLTENEIENLSRSINNSMDNSVSAIETFQELVSLPSTEKDCNNKEFCNGFEELDEEIQIELNFEYYKFLKDHRHERHAFLELFPTINALYEKISIHPITLGELSPTFSLVYESFLRDLKIALIGVDGSMDIIDCISSAIDKLITGISPNNGCKEAIACVNVSDVSHEQTIQPSKIKSNDTDSSSEIAKDNEEWTESEIGQLTILYKKGLSAVRIAELLSRTEYSIRNKIAELGLPPLPLSVTIENTALGGNICNHQGETIYSVSGLLKIINGKIYRFNVKPSCMTVKELLQIHGKWVKGEKALVAFNDSDLYNSLPDNYIDSIEDFLVGETKEKNRIKMNGKWYDFSGTVIPQTKKEERTTTTKHETPSKRWVATKREDLKNFYLSGMSIQQLAVFFETDELTIKNQLKKQRLI